jgi:peptidylprolyl isomerase
MRRVLALVLPLLFLAAACSDGGSTAADTATTVPAGGSSTTSPDKPKVQVPATPPTKLVVTDLVPGTGPAAKTGDEVILHYVGVRSADGVEFDNSYDRGEPFTVVLGAGKVIPGWEQGLLGVQAGGRRQMDIPADLAYGDRGSGTAIRPGDALSFVVDVLAVLPTSTAAEQPAITLAPAANVDAITKTDLVVGTGPAPSKGKKFAAQIMLFRADTGELLNSTWGSPPVVFDYTADTNTYPGIIAVAKGMKVGGRRQSQLPFNLMFDGKGQSQINLPPNVDVVLVMDLVAVY